jgi:putative peptide maturation system protein
MSHPLSPELGPVLQDAAMLLRSLPRRRAQLGEARAKMQDWNQRHPDVHADLIVDQPPGSLFVEYDLVFGDLEGGTLGLTWRDDDGTPWLVSYADHWASNFVASVDGQGISIQDALRALHLGAETHPDLLERIVEQKLVLTAVDRDPTPVTEAELQTAADDFRRANGLQSAADMRRWLDTHRLTPTTFASMLTSTIRAARLRKRIATERSAAYFESHADDFARARITTVRFATRDEAERFSNRARGQSLLSIVDASVVHAEMVSGFQRTLPPVLAGAGLGDVVGPYREGDLFVLAQVNSREPAQLDDETQRAIEDVVFAKWLAEQRAAANVQWHWS